MFINIGKSRWMKIVLFITTFAFVGTAFVALIVYKLSGNIQGVAEVNGRQISIAEYFYQLNLLTRQYEAEGIDTSPLKKQLQKDALRNVIQQELLYQAALSEGLGATREEVKQYIKDIPIFHENGKFSPARYTAFLSDFNISPSLFEEIMRKELSIRHLLSIHRASFYLSDDEVETFVNKQLSKISGKFLLIKPKEFKPDTEKIKNYYKTHLDEFSGKKGKKIIVYKIDKEKLGNEKAEKIAKKIYLELKNNKQPGKYEGVEVIFDGNVYDNKINLPETINNEIKKLNKNKRIALVSEDSSYYLIKFQKEISEPKPLDKVKKQIIYKLKKEYMDKELKRLYKEVNEILKREKNIDNIAVNYHESIKTVKNVPAQSLITEFNLNQNALSKIVNLKKGQLIGPFNTPYGIVIAQIDNVGKPDKKRKEEMEKLLIPILKQNKYQTLIQMYIDKLQEEASIIINRRFIQ